MYEKTLRAVLLSYHRATVHFFANANPLFALTPESTNQPLHNSYVIIVYGIIWCN